MPLAEPNSARLALALAARSYRLALTATVGELERAEADYRFRDADRSRGRVLRLEMWVDEVGACLSADAAAPENGRLAS
jgi:hypothetical protein